MLEKYAGAIVLNCFISDAHAPVSVYSVHVTDIVSVLSDFDVRVENLVFLSPD